MHRYIYTNVCQRDSLQSCVVQTFLFKIRTEKFPKMTTNGAGCHGPVRIILHIIILILIPTQRLMRIVETSFIKVHDEPSSKEREREREEQLSNCKLTARTTCSIHEPSLVLPTVMAKFFEPRPNSCFEFPSETPQASKKEPGIASTITYRY